MFYTDKKQAVSQSKRKLYYNFYIIIFLMKVPAFDKVKTWKIATQSMKYALSGCEISSLTLQNKPILIITITYYLLLHSILCSIS